MSTTATSLISSIKTRAQSVLGATYSDLAYAQNIDKNSFNGNFKRFGVLAKSQSETSSVLKYSTIDQTFELILIDSFINTAMSDSQEQAKGPALQDLAFDIYRDLITTRVGANSSVLLVSNFNTTDPETIDGKAVVIRAQFTIKYRIAV